MPVRPELVKLTVPVIVVTVDVPEVTVKVIAPVLVTVPATVPRVWLPFASTTAAPLTAPVALMLSALIPVDLSDVSTRVPS